MKLSLKNTLAVALVGLLGVNASYADDVVRVEAPRSAVVEIETTNRERAKEANETAARKAIEAVLAETRLDLDIRLIGPTSRKIAAE